jgi:hypothetical protein
MDSSGQLQRENPRTIFLFSVLVCASSLPKLEQFTVQQDPWAYHGVAAFTSFSDSMADERGNVMSKFDRLLVIYHTSTVRVETWTYTRRAELWLQIVAEAPLTYIESDS